MKWFCLISLVSFDLFYGYLFTEIFRLIQYVYQENWDQLVQDEYLQEIEEDILQKTKRIY